jgi:hypothetical protein
LDAGCSIGVARKIHAFLNCISSKVPFRSEQY